MKVSKRIFLVIGTIITLTQCFPEKSGSQKNSDKKPNIIFILTDQQHAKMMSCAGNDWVKTPAMDYIAQNGIRFTHAYATNPVCSPARVSMMTGRFPGSFEDNEGNKVKENSGSMQIQNISDEVLNTTLASFVSKAGYELVYGGKEHLPKQLIPSTLGFNDISDNERNELAESASEYIKSKHEKPYFLFVSFINPHDICYMAIRDFAQSKQDSMLLERGKVEVSTLDKAMQIPKSITTDEFYKKYAPPLPPNYEPQKDEPKAISWLINTRTFREQARENYTDENWRMHRWAYSRLTEMVDQEVQIVLDALKESGQEENTIVIFSSDHGDNDASHRLEHKTTLYEESANVPFLAMWKGHIPAGKVDDTHLVSVGLDLLPTVSDYAGEKGEGDSRGMSLRPLFEGEKVSWRKTLGVESEIGRMVVTEDRLKYLRYDAAGIEEQLLDLNKDPHETTHYTNVPEYQTRLTELRKIFDEVWFPEQ